MQLQDYIRRYCPQNSLDLRPADDWEPTELPTARPIVLIACGKSKADQAMPAGQMYTSALFRKSLALARLLAPDADIRILSAKHGVLKLDQVIEPYEQRLAASKATRRGWAERVVRDLRAQFGSVQGHYNQYVILAGADYADPITQAGLKASHVQPLRGMMIGERLAALTNPEQLADTIKRDIKVHF